MIYILLCFIKHIISQFLALKSPNGKKDSIVSKLEQIKSYMPDINVIASSSTSQVVTTATRKNISLEQSKTDLLLVDLLDEYFTNICPLLGYSDFGTLDRYIMKANHSMDVFYTLLGWSDPLMTGSILVGVVLGLFYTVLGHTTNVVMCYATIIFMYNTPLLRAAFTGYKYIISQL